MASGKKILIAYAIAIPSIIGLGKVHDVYQDWNNERVNAATEIWNKESAERARIEQEEYSLSEQYKARLEKAVADSAALADSLSRDSILNAFNADTVIVTEQDIPSDGIDTKINETEQSREQAAPEVKTVPLDGSVKKKLTL